MALVHFLPLAALQSFGVRVCAGLWLHYQWYTVNNMPDMKKKVRCIVCGAEPHRKTYRYCSNRCQIEYQYHQYIQKWQVGEVNGNRGITARTTSRHLRRYLLEKYQHRCTQCGWEEHHPLTGEVPLEIDHIDGNAENNAEGNLRLLCPNCHSLTPSFRNLNKGSGRAWRREKYLKSAN